VRKSVRSAGLAKAGVAVLPLILLLAACSGEPTPSASPGMPAACGDGVCEYGEFCAVCPEDCDCRTLAATPPMGWNSWNRFGCDINEALIRETADELVSSGMRDAGYVYLNLDDCWQSDRTQEGTIVADPDRFPGGIPALADYVHSRGLKFGLYTCAGTHTCQERPGSAGYEDIDARTYAEWGVDYVKVDWCNTEGLDSRTRYAIMRRAMDRAGRPMVLSICNWGLDAPHLWGPNTGQLWRTSGDIADFYGSMFLNFCLTQGLSAFAGPGHWNDPDMLEVGNGGMTEEEYRTHFSLWAILAAPLLAGNDLRRMSPADRDILLNREVIAVDQDPLGLPGVCPDGVNTGVWARPVAREGGRAVVLYNALFNRIALSVRWQDLGLAPGGAEVRDLWEHRDLGRFETGFQADLEPHQSRMLLVAGTENSPPSGRTWLSDHPWMYAANGRGLVQKDRSAGGRPLSLDGTVYPKGLGVAASSVILVHLGGKCSRFEAEVGIDDEAGAAGTVIFQVFADGKAIFHSGLLHGGLPSRRVDVSLNGARLLKLTVSAAGDSVLGDHADWAGAALTCR